MQVKEKKLSVFEIDSVPRAVATLAIPSVLSMLVTVLYNMVDTVFVGQTHDPYQMNAVSMATPVFMILMAFGNLFGIGGCAFISRSLGAREYDRVKKISSFSFCRRRKYSFSLQAIKSIRTFPNPGNDLSTIR